MKFSRNVVHSGGNVVPSKATKESGQSGLLQRAYHEGANNERLIWFEKLHREIFRLNHLETTEGVKSLPSANEVICALGTWGLNRDAQHQWNKVTPSQVKQ